MIIITDIKFNQPLLQENIPFVTCFANTLDN